MTKNFHNTIVGLQTASTSEDSESDTEIINQSASVQTSLIPSAISNSSANSNSVAYSNSAADIHSMGNITSTAIPTSTASTAATTSTATSRTKRHIENDERYYFNTIILLFLVTTQ